MSHVPDLAASTEMGLLGVFHLKRLWSATVAQRHGLPMEQNDEIILDKLVLNALGLGLHQTIQYLYAPRVSLGI
jgi:hypothetical protein